MPSSTYAICRSTQHWLVRTVLLPLFTYPHRKAGELDTIISAIPHCHLVTAPVIGPPANAEDASLVICMSGDYRSKKELAHLLVPAVGRKVYDLGGNLEKGNLRSCFMQLLICIIDTYVIYRDLAPTFKLIGNSIILGSLEVLAEAFTMGEKSNIGQDMVYQFIKGTSLIPSVTNYSRSNVHCTFVVKILCLHLCKYSRAFVRVVSADVSFTVCSHTVTRCFTTSSTARRVSPLMVELRTLRMHWLYLAVSVMVVHYLFVHAATSVNSRRNTTVLCQSSTRHTNTFSLLVRYMRKQKGLVMLLSRYLIGRRLSRGQGLQLDWTRWTVTRCVPSFQLNGMVMITVRAHKSFAALWSREGRLRWYDK